MKNTIIKFLERPKIVIPIVSTVAIVAGVILYGSIGHAPIVRLSEKMNESATSTEVSDNSLDLAFIKAGRLSSVGVSVGDIVKKGEVLASLDAGDALGVVDQTKGALELAKTQYASMNVQYANVKKQQDVLVANAYRTLLSSNLIAEPVWSNSDFIAVIDNNQTPQITGSYVCDKEGQYEVEPYGSGAPSGYSFTFKGLESGSGAVTHYTPQSLGECGLSIQFPTDYVSNYEKWIINIPNKKSSSYVANKNAYDLAVANRDQALKQLEANLGKNGSSEANTAQAAIDVAEGAYQTALATYQNSLIVAPMDGIVTFVDSHLKVGQSVSANKTLITIAKK